MTLQGTLDQNIRSRSKGDEKCVRLIDFLSYCMVVVCVCVCMRVCVYVCVQYPSYSTPGTHDFRTTDPYSTQLTISHPPLVVHTYTRTASVPTPSCPTPSCPPPSPPLAPRPFPYSAKIPIGH